jgi:hypothetical protein
MAPSFVVEVDFTKLRSLKGRFITAARWFSERRREIVRTLGRRWVELAQDYAPKRSGEFSKGIHFSSFTEQSRVGFHGYVPQPLGSYITEGTRPHEIRAVNTGALYFIWKEQGDLETLVPRVGGRRTRHEIHRKAGRDILIIGKGYVEHPGTVANPFTARALDMLHIESIGVMQNATANYKAIILHGEQGA